MLELVVVHLRPRVLFPSDEFETTEANSESTQIPPTSQAETTSNEANRDASNGQNCSIDSTDASINGVSSLPTAAWTSSKWLRSGQLQERQREVDEDCSKDELGISSLSCSSKPNNDRPSIPAIPSTAIAPEKQSNIINADVLARGSKVQFHSDITHGPRDRSHCALQEDQASLDTTGAAGGSLGRALADVAPLTPHKRRTRPTSERRHDASDALHQQDSVVDTRQLDGEIFLGYEVNTSDQDENNLVTQIMYENARQALCSSPVAQRPTPPSDPRTPLPGEVGVSLSRSGMRRNEPLPSTQALLDQWTGWSVVKPAQRSSTKRLSYISTPVGKLSDSLTAADKEQPLISVADLNAEAKDEHEPIGRIKPSLNLFTQSQPELRSSRHPAVNLSVDNLQPGKNLFASQPPSSRVVGASLTEAQEEDMITSGSSSAIQLVEAGC